MPRGLVAVAFVLAVIGCARPKPSAAWGARPVDVVVGTKLEAHVAWQAKCRIHMSDGFLAKNSYQDNATHRSCKAQPFEVEISCSGSCKAERFNGVGWAALEVIPLAAGKLTVTARLRRTDTDERKTIELPTVKVVKPDRLELFCVATQATGAVPCDPAIGVPATTPFVVPVIHVGQYRYHSSELRVNGSVWKEPQLFVTLADLFPDARDGKGVVPGTYPVTLELGGVTATYQVVARP